MKVFVLFVFSILSFSSQALLVDYQEDDNKSYFVFAAPNKIITYDKTSKVFLDEFQLDVVPSQFHIKDSVAYIVSNRSVNAFNLQTGEKSFIKNYSDSPSGIIATQNNGSTYIHVAVDNRIKTVNAATGAEVSDSGVRYYSLGAGYTVSPDEKSFFWRNTGSSPSDLYKASISSTGQVTEVKESPYHGDYPTGHEFWVYPDSSRVIESSGVVYFTEDLTYAGSVAGSFEDMSFSGENLVVLRNESLELFDRNLTSLGEVDLSDITATVTYMASDNDTAYLFSVNDDSTVDVIEQSLASVEQPQAGAPFDAEGKDVSPEAYVFDQANGVVYLLDKETLSVIRYSLDKEEFLTSWSLLSPATWMVFHESHERLYMGYSTGKITYFDLSLDNPIETHFTSLPTNVLGLADVGEFVFAADSSGAWNSQYTFSEDGTQIDSEDWKHVSSEYEWNEALNRIYHFRNGVSPGDIEYSDLDTQGQFTSEGDSPYHDSRYSNAPLRLDPAGQLLLSGAGIIHDAVTLVELNSLANDIDDAVWVEGTLITVKSNEAILQEWGSNYELIKESPELAANKIRLFEYNGSLVVIRVTTSGLMFEVMDWANPGDLDSDSVADLFDNCPDDANENQENYDNDIWGDACDLDDDNDGMPDEHEAQEGLNPLDASDASSDYDNDGFSNGVEYAQGTNYNDVDDVPQELTEFSESFEESTISPLISYQRLWMIEGSSSSDGEQSIKAPNLFNEGESVSLYIKGVFETGELSFDYFFQETNSFSSISARVYIDSNSSSYSSLRQGGEWQEIQAIQLSGGYHEIEIRVTVYSLYGNNNSDNYEFRLDNIEFLSASQLDSDLDGVVDGLDNCVNVSNSSQTDTDLDGYGDECDFDADGNGVDDYYDNLDDDGDGITNISDNCQFERNTSQEDFDEDGYGDVCDLDDDNDGIEDEVENSYNFLNPFNPDDALEDFDGDGVNNSREIRNGLDPEVPNEIINMIQNFPLGNIEWTYDNSRTVTSEIIETGKYLYSSYDFAYHLERRQDGVYVTKMENYYAQLDTETITFGDGVLMVPNEMVLGGSMTNSISVQVLRGTQTITTDVVTTIGSFGTDYTTFQDAEIVSQRVVFVIDNESLFRGHLFKLAQNIGATFLFNINNASFNYLENVDVEVLESNSDNSTDTDKQANNVASSGGGLFSTWGYVLLSLFGLFSLRERHRKTEALLRYSKSRSF